MFRNDIEAAIERARIAEDQLRRLETKDEKNQAELDELRASLEAQRREIARLRKLAPAAEKPGASASRALFLSLAMVLLGAGVAAFLAIRSASDRAPTTPARPVRAVPASVTVAQPEPRPEVSPPLGEEIGDRAMTALLTAHRWRGTPLGELRFVFTGEKLEGRITTQAGSRQAVEVVLGRLATLTLRLGREVDGMNERLTLHGALCADRRTIRGTLERVLTEGANQHAEQGVFTLTAAR